MDQYIGQIVLAGFNFPTAGWAFCDGSLLSINENSALFNLIGTTYGGDGVNTFDMMAALEQWVELKKPPAQVLAKRVSNDLGYRTRPLCPFPQVARYKGTRSG